MYCVFQDKNKIKWFVLYYKYENKNDFLEKFKFKKKEIKNNDNDK